MRGRQTKTTIRASERSGESGGQDLREVRTEKAPRSGHDYWHTPPELFAVLDAEFGFVLDAAANESNRLCTRWIDESEDALTSGWYGRSVWCNPPYSTMAAFVFRAWQQCQEQKNTVVLLIPAYTDPAYWWDCIVPYADEIRFLKGRVSFLDRGQSRTSARFPSVVIVFRYRRGVAKGSPRVWWWDWKAGIEKPLLSAVEKPESIPARFTPVDEHQETGSAVSALSSDVLRTE